MLTPEQRLPGTTGSGPGGPAGSAGTFWAHARFTPAASPGSGQADPSVVVYRGHLPRALCPPRPCGTQGAGQVRAPLADYKRLLV